MNNLSLSGKPNRARHISIVLSFSGKNSRTDDNDTFIPDSGLRRNNCIMFGTLIANDFIASIANLPHDVRS